MLLSLLTLNISRPTPQRAEDVLRYLWHRPEQVLALTEVATGGGSALIARVCRAAGYDVVSGVRTAGTDRLGVLVIGRGVSVRAVDDIRPAVLPHRVATVEVMDGQSERGSRPLRLAAVYGAASDPVRYSSASQRQRKRDWLAAFDAWLPAWLSRGATPALLLGDLNVVAPGHQDGLRYVLPEERVSYQAILEAGMSDAYRLMHPDSDAHAREPSWIDHSGLGCRYDHAFVRDAHVVTCDLDQTPRLEGFTDHAALSVTIRW